MEILTSIFFFLTAFVIIFLLVLEITSKNKEKWYTIPLYFISTLLFIICFIMAITALDTTKQYVQDKINYKQGYQDALDTKFEQRIDTVYIKKKP